MIEIKTQRTHYISQSRELDFGYKALMFIIVIEF